MTNNAQKKAAREYMRAHGLNYTAALRAISTPSPIAGPVVTCTYRFVGTGAPEPVSFDATPWMPEIVKYDLRSWEFDPNASAPDSMFDNLLARAAEATGDRTLKERANWLRANESLTVEEYDVPNEYGDFVTRGEPRWDYPYVVTFNRHEAEQWTRAQRRQAPVLSDFVTPEEQRRWFAKHEPGALDCPAGRHHYDNSPSPFMGECIGCGALMLVGFNGDDVHRVVDEDEYLDEAAKQEAYCNWAPPTRLLRGETQWEWNRRNHPAAW